MTSIFFKGVGSTTNQTRWGKNLIPTRTDLLGSLIFVCFFFAHFWRQIFWFFVPEKPEQPTSPLKFGAVLFFPHVYSHCPYKSAQHFVRLGDLSFAPNSIHENPSLQVEQSKYPSWSIQVSPSNLPPWKSGDQERLATRSFLIGDPELEAAIYNRKSIGKKNVSYGVTVVVDGRVFFADKYSS